MPDGCTTRVKTHSLLSSKNLKLFQETTVAVGRGKRELRGRINRNGQRIACGCQGVKSEVQSVLAGGLTWQGSRNQ